MTNPNTASLFSGKSANVRAAAMDRVAQLSQVENISRAESIANLRVALGNKPTVRQAEAAQHEWQIGRIATRLAKNDLPKDCTTAEEKLAFARLLFFSYQAPFTGTGTAPKLRKGMVGRRTDAQQKIVRASAEAWSQVKAELGIGAAQTQKERNTAKAAKAKRAAHHNSKPEVADLPAAPKMTPQHVVGHVTLQLNTLRAFCDKHAKLMPIEMSATVDGLSGLAKLAVTNAKAFETRANK